MTSYLSSFLSMIILTLSLTPPQAASPHATSMDFSQRDPELTQYGTVSAAARWDRSTITVCWLDHPELSAERTVVHEAIKATWMKASTSLIFTGWGNCTSASADIRISVIDDASAPRSYVGRNVIGRSPSMWLNFTFSSWSSACQSRRNECIAAIAAHEFGHAAGFEHEQLQPDAPKACIDHLKRSDSWEVLDHKIDALTPYDPDSIMNYCNSIWLNNGKLSANDQKAINVLFPSA